MSELTLSRGINLYGMMNAGKTTVGETIAEQYELPFVDTDDLITSVSGRSPGEIIQADGRDEFMRIQQEVILGQPREGIEIWATGGAVARDPVIVEHLRAFGTGVFLYVDLELIEARTSEEEFSNIVNPNGLGLPEIYAERIPLYEAASDLSIIIKRADQTPEEVARMVVDGCRMNDGAVVELPIESED